MKFNYWAVIGLEGSGLGFEGSVLGLVLEHPGFGVSLRILTLTTSPFI